MDNKTAPVSSPAASPEANITSLEPQATVSENTGTEPPPPAPVGLIKNTTGAFGTEPPPPVPVDLIKNTTGAFGTEPPPVPVDLIQNITGAFGKYQLLLCFLVFLSKIPIAWHQMAIIFLNPNTPFTCDGKPGACPCPNPVYDRSIFTETIISQWNLICGESWKAKLSQTIFQLGTLVGSVIFGMASDRFGRRIPFIVAIVIQIITGIAAAFCYTFAGFSIMRLLIGVTVGGTMVIGFVIVMEFMGPQYRDVVSALYQVPFNIGHMLLPLISYSYRHYRIFQLLISVPIVILLCYICLVPETPRWLIAVKRTDKAVKILERVAKMNKLPTSQIKADVEAYQATLHNTAKKGTIIDLLRTRNLRKNIIAMSLNWLSCSYFFYGTTQYISRVSGDIFSNVAASACVTLLGTLFSIPLLKIMGRRTIVIVFNFIQALSFFIIIGVPDGVGKVILGCIGNVTSFIVFVVVYLYCSELFPTVVRNAAIGLSSMMARVGSMVAPLVVGLKDEAEWLPPFLFGIVPLIAGFVTFLLPETKGVKLMTTVEEGEEFGKKKKPAPSK